MARRARIPLLAAVRARGSRRSPPRRPRRIRSPGRSWATTPRRSACCRTRPALYPNDVNGAPPRCITSADLARRVGATLATRRSNGERESGGGGRGEARVPAPCGGEMTTLVTGGFGCIGAWVVKRLLAAGERPVLYDLSDDPWRMRMIVGPERLGDMVVVRGDIADRDAVVRVVGDHGITRIIHLAAWQVPLCRQDPSKGALVNVVGTANVFEAAKAHGVGRVTYFSSAAVFGPPHLYGPGPISDDAPPKPATHYGVYKVANEETARIYWEEHRIASMGFRPLSVYGPGRDFGLTADPTIALKAAVLGRSFEIRWGGATDLIYADDVAQACPPPARSPPG